MDPAAGGWKGRLDALASWYPLGLGLVPVLGLYVANADQVPWHHILVPLAISQAVIGAALLLLRRRLDHHRAALAVTALLIAFFGFGYLLDPVQAVGWLPYGTFVGPQLLVAIPLAAAAAAAVVALARSTANLRDVSRIAAVMLASLAVLNGATAVFSAAAPSASDALRLELQPAAPGPRPDIYYIIPDGYGSNQVLESVYGYNNSAFLSDLEGLGFGVAPAATANYPMTALSLSSTLNMVYLDPLAAEMEGSANWMAALDRTEDSNLLRYLTGAGYHTVHVSSGWGATASNAHFEEEVDCGGPTPYTMELIHSTLLRLFENRLVGGPLRDRLACQLDAIEAVAAQPGPTFTFAHLIAPHPPFVYAAEGGANRAGEMELAGDPWLDRAGYLGQLEFLNARLTALVASILETSPDAIIVIQADHGPASRLAALGTRTLPVYSGEPGPRLAAAMEERYGILAAYHAPGISIPDDLTPVNGFRTLLRDLFGADLAPLEDRHFYAGYASPYRFSDVGSIVGSGS